MLDRRVAYGCLSLLMAAACSSDPVDGESGSTSGTPAEESESGQSTTSEDGETTTSSSESVGDGDSSEDSDTAGDGDSSGDGDTVGDGDSAGDGDTTTGGDGDTTGTDTTGTDTTGDGDSTSGSATSGDTGGDGDGDADSECTPAPFEDVRVVESGDEWRWDTGTDHGTAWRTLSFNDDAWASGGTQIGFGESDEKTTIPPGDEGEPSYYFRRVVYLDGSVSSGVLDLIFDDGIAVWINGTQVFAANIDDGVGYADWASATSDENESATQNLAGSAFVEGANVIAVMVKNRSAGSSDLSFDLSLSVDLDTCPVPTNGSNPPANCPPPSSPPLAASGLPLLESNPGAPIALFVDYDGGTYHSSSSGDTVYSGYDTNGNPAVFNAQEQADIIRSWEHMSQYFSMFDVNVTTDDSVRAASTGWGWIVVTEEESGGSASLSQAAIGTEPYARAYCGAGSVRSSDRSRRIAHELGHNFTLEHNGVWEANTFYKWEDWSSWDGIFGSVMGGGGEGNLNGWAIAHSQEDEGLVQDSMAVIQQRVVDVGQSSTGWRVDDFGGSVPSPMCNGGYRLERRGVLGHPQDEDLFIFDWAGGPAVVTVRSTEVSSADPVVELRDDTDALLGADGYYPDLPAGSYEIRVSTRSELANGYDKTDLTSYDDVARSELGSYELIVD